jgi:hypothetical protein
MRYKMVVSVAHASRADLDRWLANHATGRFATGPEFLGLVSVYLAEERDRIALRESFDVERVQFVD